MYESQILNRYRFLEKHRLAQGDILKSLDVRVSCSIPGSDGLDILRMTPPFLVILSQDCDLSNDYNGREIGDDAREFRNDKYLQTVLVCPAYLLDQFVLGTHVINWEMQTFNAKKQSKLKANDEYDRYHYLVNDDVLHIPELVLDFKHFVTVPRDTIYEHLESLYVGSLSELYRERLSQRFTNYLNRIGLPD